VAGQLPEDKPTQILLDHCRAYQAEPPADDAPLTLRLTEK